MADTHAAAATAVDRYTSLDLSAEGPLARALLDRAADEASNPRIALTAKGDPGTLSQGLTPVMNEWLGSRIGPLRGEALAELESQARNIKIAANVDGSLVEADVDRAEKQRAERRVEVLEAFNSKHKKLLDDVNRLQGEYDLIRADEGGRDAKVPDQRIEFGILIPLILLPESLLNFESFRRAPIIQSDAMALGATVLVGIGIAAAAYCIGLFIRQFNYFAREDDKERPRAGWPLYTWGSTLLFVSLGSVAAARYYYLLPRIQEAIVLGGPVPNLPFSIGSLLFGNLICFLVGAVLTFFLNDPNPEFADKAADLAKQRRRLRTVSRREVDATLDQINARAKREKDEKRRRARQMVGKPGYSQLYERFGRLSSKDTEVVGLLNAYRSALVRAIHNPHFEFEMRELTADRADPVVRVRPEQFASIPLELTRSV